LPRVVHLDHAQLHHRLRMWRPDVELFFGHQWVAFGIPTEDLPLLVYIFEAPPEAYAAPLCDALIWSPAWDAGWREMSQRYHASIAVELATQRPVNYASMLLAFLAVLDTVLFSLPDEDRDAAVLHWIPAQQLLTFERYRTLRTELGPVGPAVNIRIANATGRPGELTADTLGLAELGLPDLQLVFSDRDPGEVIAQLRKMVRAMLVGERLGCGWVEETSLVPPARDALTLHLDWS
jgi:hypothetical protein